MSSELTSSAFGYLAGYLSPALGTSAASAIASFTISFHARLIEKRPLAVDKTLAQVFKKSLTDAFSTGSCALTALLLNRTFTEFKSSNSSAGAMYGVAAVAQMVFSFAVSAAARG